MSKGQVKWSECETNLFIIDYPNMTNKELVLNMLAELSTKEISEVTDTETFDDHMEVARRGGNIAKEARRKLEEETGRPVVTPINAKDFLQLEQDKDNPSIEP